MPTLPALISFFGERFPRERTFVASVARGIREAGLIETGKPGRGGRQATMRDAVTLMIALASTPIALHAPDRTALIASMLPDGAFPGEPDPHLDFDKAFNSNTGSSFADILENFISSEFFDSGFYSRDKNMHHVFARVSIYSVARFYSQAEICFNTRIRRHVPGYNRPSLEGFETKIRFRGPGTDGDSHTLFRREVETDQFSTERQMIDVATEINAEFFLALKRFLSTDLVEVRT